MGAVIESPNQPVYPVYIVSKGRHDQARTAKALARDGVPFKIVVEPQEAELYAAAVGAENVLELPFSNLGLGSIPARNWIWEHAAATGAERHWILDDNINGYWRRWKARKIRAHSGTALRVTEVFTDRYENIGISGNNYYMFCPDKQKSPAFYLNVHVYSNLLIRNDLPYRWRGRYNEDTDLCLQVLSGGYCTVLINAFLAWKETTLKMRGGNMEELYQGDGRLRMARSLERMWPGVVKVDRRFKRPQHIIKDAWGGFTTPLIRKPEYAELDGTEEFGLLMKEVKPIQSETLRQLTAGHTVPYLEGVKGDA